MSPESCLARSDVERARPTTELRYAFAFAPIPRCFSLDSLASLSVRFARRYLREIYDFSRVKITNASFESCGTVGEIM